MIESMVTAGCSLASALLVAIMNNTLIKYRLDALEKRMDKHATMDDRLIVIETELKNVKRRIENLENAEGVKKWEVKI